MNAIRTMCVGAVTAGLTATAVPAIPATGTTVAAGRGVCRGADNCTVVAHRDVDGDRRRDHIGWVQRSSKKVVIRVRTADGERLRKRIDVRFWWGGGHWAGAPRIDGKRGHDLVIGSWMGAHTPGYTILTYRRGGLRVLESPLRQDHWYIDAAYSIYSGWWRHSKDGRVTMTLKWASRTKNNRFRGENNRYVWRKGRWAERRIEDTRYRNGKKAGPIAGWHVLGLKRWPGI